MRAFACSVHLTVMMLLAGCSSDDSARLTRDPDVTASYSLYSPNGEPLNGGILGTGSCNTLVGNWFDRLSGHTPNVSHTVFMTDARMQFTRMDIDRNGYIVSEELDRFRAPYTIPQSEDADKKSFFGESKKDRHIRSDPSWSVADPVMSADTNLDFRVTPEEFMHQARDVFARLDTNHDGLLTREEALRWCAPKDK